MLHKREKNTCKHIIVLFVETPRKFITAKLTKNKHTPSLIPPTLVP